MLGAPAPRYDQILRQFKGERGLFVQDILENEVGGSFDPWPIQKLCDEKTWTPGLVISCEPSMGGIGHVRNAQLNCIRLAIEVGGELPSPFQPGINPQYKKSHIRPCMQLPSLQHSVQKLTITQTQIS